MKWEPSPGCFSPLRVGSGVLPQHDGVGGDGQLLADFFSQCCVGGSAWDQDGEGECESDFDHAGVVGRLGFLEFEGRNQRCYTVNAPFS